MVFGQRVAMAPTLDAALSRLFKDFQQDTPAPPSNPKATTPGQLVTTQTPLKVLIKTAGEQYELGQRKLKAGDFAGYGEANKQLEKTLTELKKGVQ